MLMDPWLCLANPLPSELAQTDGAYTEGLGCAGALSRSMVGTESYMAPEVVQKQQHDASVDYWSFGVLLFEMLTGDLPYRHKQKKKMLEMIAQAKKPKFPKFLGSVSRTANRQAAFPSARSASGWCWAVLSVRLRVWSHQRRLCALRRRWGSSSC